MTFYDGAIEARASADTNREPAELSVSGEIDRLDLGKFLRSLDMDPLVTGRFASKFDLTAQSGDEADRQLSIAGIADL